MISQYIYSSIIYTVNNRHLYLPNNEIHKHRTRYNKDLHLPIANTKKYKEGPYFSAIKLYNHLPNNIKSLSPDHKHFKNTLKEIFVKIPSILSKNIMNLTIHLMFEIRKD
jgi:hypothetical protein